MTADGTKRQVPLHHAAQMWPTPNAGQNNYDEDPAKFEARRAHVRAKGINGNGMGTPLGVAAKLWPTPRAGEGDKLSAGKQRNDSLNQQARAWPTPNATDTKGPSGKPGRRPQADDNLPASVAS